MGRELMTSVQCDQIARGTGQRCRRFAIKGGRQCLKHGGQLPVVQAKAQRNIDMWDIMRTGTPRHPFEVIRDGLHYADTIMRETLEKLAKEGTLTHEDLTRFSDQFERSCRLAKTMLDAKAQEMYLRQTRMHGEEIAGVINRALAACHLPIEYSDAIRSALADELRALGQPDRRVQAITGGTSDEPNGSRPSTLDDVEGEVVTD